MRVPLLDRLPLDRRTLAFWCVIAALLSAAGWFSLGVARMRDDGTRGARLETGDLVRLVRVIDGDTIAVSKDDEGGAVVRVLGIQAFESRIDRDRAAAFGRAAEEAIRRLVADRPMRVLLHSTPKDRQGRTLATLFVDADDLGLHLVGQGLALVYTPYPFPAMPVYLREQAHARQARVGLWADPEVVERADALAQRWRKVSR